MSGTTKTLSIKKRWFHNDVSWPLMRVGLLILKNVLKTLVKSVLIQLALMTAASATDAAVQNKSY